MPDERDELILIIRDIYNDGRSPEWPELHLSGLDAARIADAVLAAGFHRDPEPHDSDPADAPRVNGEPK